MIEAVEILIQLILHVVALMYMIMAFFSEKGEREWRMICAVMYLSLTRI